MDRYRLRVPVNCRLSAPSSSYFVEKKIDLYIDFDGTIHDIENPLPGHKMGGPTPGSVNTIRYWKQRGYRIVVFTVRGDHKYIRDWLSYYHIPFDKVTNIKGSGIYIDDHAIHFDGNWNKMIAYVHRLQSEADVKPAKAESNG